MFLLLLSVLRFLLPILLFAYAARTGMRRGSQAARVT